ncbi:MAG: nylB, partial [Gemmatimonadetes bacterium]|nr:nylB [Gemmatimonadota bacterium]
MRFRQTHVVLLISSLVVSVRLPAQGKPAGDDLLGLWGGEAFFGPQIRGELVLDRRGSRWTARVGGFEATADQAGDSVVMRLAGGQGTVRLWVGGATPEGFWIQPEGFGAPYATPLHFRAAGMAMWRAEVVPLDEKFPLYLNVTRAPDGVLRGVFRNPAVNWPGRAGWYRVEHDGDNVSFIVPRTGKVQYRQTYDSGQRAIGFDFGGPVVLHPRTLEQAVGLVSRSPSLPPYEYRRPADLSDGWRVADPRTAGVDEGALQTIVRNIIAADPLNDSLPRLHSLLVARRGRLVLDEYFMGYGADQPHDLRSASKTMTSVMAGVAMYRGATFDMSTPVGGTAITVGQLLTHTSGKACDDDDDASPGNEDTMQSQSAQNDWYKFFLALPEVHKPGTTYAYCSAGINMVGSVIGKATHSWLPLFFD